MDMMWKMWQGLLSDRLKKAKEDLDDALESIRLFVRPVESPKDSAAYSRYFCGNTEKKDELKENEQKRIALYKQTSTLIRAYAALPMKWKKLVIHSRDRRDKKRCKIL